MYSYGSPHTATQKQDDQHERTFSSYVRIQVVVLKTYLGRWTIGRSGERGSGISVLPARYDDDDDDESPLDSFNSFQILCIVLRFTPKNSEIFVWMPFPNFWRSELYHVAAFLIDTAQFTLFCCMEEKKPKQTKCIHKINTLKWG